MFEPQSIPLRDYHEKTMQILSVSCRKQSWTKEISTFETHETLNPSALSLNASNTGIFCFC